MIDLHNHTSFSDGSLSPEALIEMATERQVSQLAITDHDTIDGLLHLLNIKHQHELKLIAGVEISANWGKQGLHIVGLNIDIEHQGLQSFLKQQQSSRKIRVMNIAKKLELAGVSHAVDDISYFIDSQPMVCRTHIAQYLVDRGVVKNFAEAFKKYLGKGCKAFVKDDWFALQDVIAIIKAAGGVSVLAHPMRYGLGTNRLKCLVEEFAQLGGNALEVSYPNINPGHKNLLASWANQFKLLASQGSDFHSPDKSWVKLGKFPAMPEEVTPVWSLWN